MEVAGNGNDLAASTSACRLRVTVMVLESCLDLFVRVLPIHLKKKKGGGDGGNIQEADVVVPSALSLYTPCQKTHTNVAKLCFRLLRKVLHSSPISA